MRAATLEALDDAARKFDRACTHADVGVDAHRVAFAESLPQKPHGVQRQRGRVEGVYARVGRSGRVGGLAVKDDRFAGEAVAGHVAQKEVAFAGNHMYCLLYTSRCV